MIEGLRARSSCQDLHFAQSSDSHPAGEDAGCVDTETGIPSLMRRVMMRGNVGRVDCRAADVEMRPAGRCE